MPPLHPKGHWPGQMYSFRSRQSNEATLRGNYKKNVRCMHTNISQKCLLTLLAQGKSLGTIMKKSAKTQSTLTLTSHPCPRCTFLGSQCRWLWHPQFLVSYLFLIHVYHRLVQLEP